jgi:predicted transcriptional regulator
VHIHLTPDTQAKLDKLAHDSGRPAEELVEDALASFLDEVAQVNMLLDRRYEDLNTGRVRPVDGADALARIRDKSRARHAERHA